MLARMLTRGLGIIALGLLLACPPGTHAGPMQTPVYFSATGSIDSFNVSGTPVVTFQGASGLIESGTPFSLGNFDISAPPAGTTTTYTDIPFQIMFKTEAVNGAVPSPNDTPVVLTGVLNGTVTEGAAGSTPQSNLTVSFSSPQVPLGPFPPLRPYFVNVPPFQTGGLMNYLGVTNPGNNGQPVTANLITTPVPEPSSIAVFACLAALGVWQKRRIAGR